MPELIAALSLGILGSAHCAGMCGGFYLMAGKGAWSRQVPYVAGKTVTYMLLGAIAGGIGATVSLFAGARFTLTLIIGFGLVVAGLVWMGLVPRFIKGSPVSQWVARTISKMLERTGPMAPFALGLSNGLLPCGLLYAALGMAAATTSVVGGVATMGVFGLATIPGLALFGILARKIGEPLVRRAHLIGGVAMIAFGIMTLMRAMHAMQASGGSMMH